MGGPATAKIREAATARQVADWQKEDTEGEAQVADRRLQQTHADESALAIRARNVGAIKNWLVLAPIPFEGGTAVDALDLEQIPHEATLRVQDGERVMVGHSERVWRALRLQDYAIDFNYFLGETINQSVAYAVCYIQSEAAQSGLSMRVASDDQSKLYLNGKQIYRREEVRSMQAGEEEVSGVELKAGLNVLVFKVVNEIDVWKGSVRFIDAQGNPLKGIKVTLTP